MCCCCDDEKLTVEIEMQEREKEKFGIKNNHMKMKKKQILKRPTGKPKKQRNVEQTKRGMKWCESATQIHETWNRLGADLNFISFHLRKKKAPRVSPKRGERVSKNKIVLIIDGRLVLLFGRMQRFNFFFGRKFLFFSLRAAERAPHTGSAGGERFGGAWMCVLASFFFMIYRAFHF